MAAPSPVLRSDGFGPSVTGHVASGLLKVLTWELLQSQRRKLETDLPLRCPSPTRRRLIGKYIYIWDEIKRINAFIWITAEE